MGNGKLCVCGHNTTDHTYQYNTNHRWGACQWYDCVCEKYQFDRLVPAKHIPYSERVYAPIITEPRKPSMPFLISECNKDGTINNLDYVKWVKTHPPKSKFNHGEYP